MSQCLRGGDMRGGEVKQTRPNLLGQVLRENTQEKRKAFSRLSEQVTPYLMRQAVFTAVLPRAVQRMFSLCASPFILSCVHRLFFKFSQICLVLGKPWGLKDNRFIRQPSASHSRHSQTGDKTAVLRPSAVIRPSMITRSETWRYRRCGLSRNRK